MTEFATLLQALAAILWPLFAFTALFVFRSQIADIARRLKKGKLLGQEIELDESLNRLDKSATSIEKTIAELPPQTTELLNQQEQAREERVIDEILFEAARSPKVALIRLASELEKLTRQLLASTGHLNGRKHIPVAHAIVELHETFGLPRHVPSSIKLFWETRNRLIHGGEGTDEDILRAVDSGLTILKALQAFPCEINTVYHPGVDLFASEELTDLIPNVKGVILETTAPGGATKTFRIFPTTKTHFQKGHQVAWEWNMQNGWGPSWYRDPDTGEVKSAFHSAAEFVGRHLDEL